MSDEGPALVKEAHELFRQRDVQYDGGIGLPFARKLAEAEDVSL